MVVFPLIFVTIHQWRHMVLEFALEGFACFAGQEFRQDAGIKAPFCSVTHEKKIHSSFIARILEVCLSLKTI